MAIAAVAARIARRTISSTTTSHVEVTKAVRQVGSFPRPEYAPVQAHLPFKYQNKNALALKIATLLALPFSVPFACAKYTHHKNGAASP